MACRMPTPKATPHRLAEGAELPMLRLAGLHLRPVRRAVAEGRATVSMPSCPTAYLPDTESHEGSGLPTLATDFLHDGTIEMLPEV